MSAPVIAAAAPLDRHDLRILLSDLGLAPHIADAVAQGVPGAMGAALDAAREAAQTMHDAREAAQKAMDVVDNVIAGTDLAGAVDAYFEHSGLALVLLTRDLFEPWWASAVIAAWLPPGAHSRGYVCPSARGKPPLRVVTTEHDADPEGAA